MATMPMSGRIGDAEQAADDEVEGALDGHVEAAELDVADVEQGDALDVVDQRTGADDLEQTWHDVDLDAAVGAGAHDAQEVVVAGARERDDDAVDLLTRDDRVQVVQSADHRHIGYATAVATRLPVVQEPDELDAVLRVRVDLGRQRVADLPCADDEHPLLERRPGPHCGSAEPAQRRNEQDRDEPEGDERGHRRPIIQRQHERDEQHPAGGGERRESVQ